MAGLEPAIQPAHKTKDLIGFFARLVDDHFEFARVSFSCLCVDVDLKEWWLSGVVRRHEAHVPRSIKINCVPIFDGSSLLLASLASNFNRLAASRHDVSGRRRTRDEKATHRNRQN